MTPKTKRDKRLAWWISRLMFFNFLLSVVIALLVVNNTWFGNHFNFTYDSLSELFNVSLVSGVFYVLVTYRDRLCLYNKISSWAQVFTGVFNLVCMAVFDPEDHKAYSDLYVNFMLYPTAVLALNYMIIEERKRKRDNES